MDAQQVKTGEQTAENRAGNVASVKKSEPGNSSRRGLDPARHGGQRRPHQQGGRHQTDPGHHTTDDDSPETAPAHGRVDLGDPGHPEQNGDADGADPQLEHGIDAQGMMPSRNQAGKQITAQAHSSHVGAEQNAQGNRGQADDQLQKLQPDNFIDQRGATAADEQKQHRRQKPARCQQAVRFVWFLIAQNDEYFREHTAASPLVSKANSFTISFPDNDVCQPARVTPLQNDVRNFTSGGNRFSAGGISSKKSVRLREEHDQLG